jgi:putative transposase
MAGLLALAVRPARRPAATEPRASGAEADPTAAWVWWQLIEATPWDRKPRYLIHDNDRAWGHDFSHRAPGLGIKSLFTPIQAPRANSIAERAVGTIRRECLDHLIPLNERPLRLLLHEFVDYYNHDRPHRSLNLEPPSL